MHILPAIDMKNHEVVRLSQGEMNLSITYNTSIVSQARTWVELGATHLHLVDLNGAFEGAPCHFDEISTIAKEHPHLHIQVGGGIRTHATIERYLESGVSACILGTVALKNPDFFKEACAHFPQQIILGLDAKNGFVATEGWSEISQTRATDILSQFSDLKLHSVIYTDIAKDGMLQSMNFEEIEIVSKLGVPVTASGGLTSLEDIQKLLTLRNIFGVIAGKALYENRFSLSQALNLVSRGTHA